MSRRPIEAKKRRRVAKALRRQDLPAHIDLVEWLISRGHAPSKKKARELILAKRVKSESHVLGVTKALVPSERSLLDALRGRDPEMVEKEVVAPLVDASLRGTIQVF